MRAGAVVTQFSSLVFGPRDVSRKKHRQGEREIERERERERED